MLVVLDLAVDLGASELSVQVATSTRKHSNCCLHQVLLLCSLLEGVCRKTIFFSLRENKAERRAKAKTTGVTLTSNSLRTFFFHPPSGADDYTH